MATKIVMEALSPTMEEGRLVKWLKNEGDAVKSGDVLAEVETDKAIMELVARGEGVLRARLVDEGAATPIGQLLGVIAKADEDISALTSGAKPSAPAPAAAENEKPEAKQDPRTSVPENAEQSQGEASTPPQERDRRGAQRIDTSTHSHQTDAQPADGPSRASPLARRLASERGINLGSLQGSGPNGRIIKRDIEAAMERGTSSAQPAARGGAEYVDVPLSQMRKTIAKRLSESIGPIPTFYLTAELDVTSIADLRTSMAELGPEYKVSFNDILMKATAIALTKHPEVNAHWTGTSIRQFNRVHLGMAVAIEDGLITPVIFDADTKGLADIGAEAKTLAKKARDRKLQPSEYTGATFTVSNLGMFGIDQFTAIINPPEAGILAIGGVEDKPVVVNGELQIRKRVRITMSCDHRAIDGATGAKFLQTLRRLVENPLMLIY